MRHARRAIAILNGFATGFIGACQYHTSRDSQWAQVTPRFRGRLGGSRLAPRQSNFNREEGNSYA
jgi:hypothetical protein